jgi:hypothetical protein
LQIGLKSLCHERERQLPDEWLKGGCQQTLNTKFMKKSIIMFNIRLKIGGALPVSAGGVCDCVIQVEGNGVIFSCELFLIPRMVPYTDG